MISRQRKWQLKMRDEGRCETCGKPIPCGLHHMNRLQQTKINKDLRKKYEEAFAKEIQMLLKGERDADTFLDEIIATIITEAERASVDQ